MTHLTCWSVISANSSQHSAPDNSALCRTPERRNHGKGGSVTLDVAELSPGDPNQDQLNLPPGGCERTWAGRRTRQPLLLTAEQASRIVVEIGRRRRAGFAHRRPGRRDLRARACSTSSAVGAAAGDGRRPARAVDDRARRARRDRLRDTRPAATRRRPSTRHRRPEPGA